MRVVQQWGDWILGHIDGSNYKILKFNGNQWVDHAVFSAEDDRKAAEKIKEFTLTAD